MAGHTLSGGNETTICEIIHGMIIQGDHYGPMSIGQPNDRVQSRCTRRGQRIAELAKKLFG